MIVDKRNEFFFLFKSCIRLFKVTKNSHAAVSYGVNKTHKTNNKQKKTLNNQFFRA